MIDLPSYDANKYPSHYELKVPSAALVKKEAFQCMDHLTGWCSKSKASYLIDLILRYHPEVVVEIGVWGGMSLVPMACAVRANQMGVVYGIDPWSNLASVEEVKNEVNKEYWHQVDHEYVLNGLISRIGEFSLRDWIRLLRCTSEDAPAIEGIGLLHVDGNHAEKTSLYDVQKWVPFVKSGGIIIFDDMSWHENGQNTTARAVEWLDSHCKRMADFTDDCQWGVWVKP